MNIKRLLLPILLLAALTVSSQELVYQDREGVIRYTADNTEVGVFGANYCLPSASDYRAAHKVAPTLELKKRMIDIDMEHFARMGFRALRLSFWGDWENSTREGALLDNEHLDLLDYLIWRASERGILMLFSPTVGHAAWWPDGDKNLPGFAAHYPKAELTFDSDAIRAQQRYMTEFLNYRNRYTQRLYKEEPHIIAIEILNEPARIMGRNEEIRQYIDTMSETIRKTGCRKIIAYNISENFYIAPAIRSSKAECVTYGWYPTQLNHGETLRGNYLPYVNDYTPMKQVEVGPRSKMVYEFDAPDLVCSYMYPAQVREFREGGVQWAAMFSYDMIGTAPWNLGWQTHLLNMVYTPQKAVSAMIAVKGMATLERGRDWGRYPHNNRFGHIEVDSEADRSCYYDGEELYYSNSAPEGLKINYKTLRKVVGVGSSEVVASSDNCLYFVERTDRGWTLELYPAVAQVDDPYKWPRLDRRVFTLDEGERTLRLNLPGCKQTVSLLPGRYLLNGKQVERIGDVRYHLAPEQLFIPQRDYPTLLFTRGGFFSPSYDSRPSQEGNLRLYAENLVEKEEYWFPADIAAQHYIGDRLQKGQTPKAMLIKVRALTPTTTTMRLLVSESDFGSWGTTLSLSTEWQTIQVDMASMRPDQTPQLPQDWPGISPYYRPDYGGTGSEIDWSEVENLYLSLRSGDFEDRGAAPKGIEVASIEVVY